MRDFSELRSHADQLLFSDDPWGALHGYAALLRLSPRDGDARLRVADALLATGQVQRAAKVYAAIARHDAHAGYPLRSLLALKVLSALEPQLESLLTPFAALYADGSARFEGKMVRLSPPDPKTALPEGFSLQNRPEPEQLAQVAETVATDLSQVAVYPEALPRIPLFSELPAEAFAKTLGAMKLLRVRPGDVVLRQGDLGHSFFVVARGAVSITRSAPGSAPLKLATLYRRSIFGEMALVSASPRSATVTALEDTDLFEFDREALAAASHEMDTIAKALDKFTRERLIQNLLATAQLFRPLDKKQRMDLMRRFSVHDVEAGTVLIQQGTAGQGLYLLLHGEASVEKEQGDERLTVASLGPGEVFGEISLVQDEPTTATVRASRNSTVLFLARETFQKLASAVPAVQEYVEQLGGERLLDTRVSMTELEAGEDIEILI